MGKGCEGRVVGALQWADRACKKGPGKGTGETISGVTDDELNGKLIDTKTGKIAQRRKRGNDS